jgi:hypothetical protein
VKSLSATSGNAVAGGGAATNANAGSAAAAGYNAGPVSGTAFGGASSQTANVAATGAGPGGGLVRQQQCWHHLWLQRHIGSRFSPWGALTNTTSNAGSVGTVHQNAGSWGNAGYFSNGGGTSGTAGAGSTANAN